MTDVQLQPERLPTFSLPNIVRLRDALTNRLVSRYAEISLVNVEELDTLLDDMMPFLSGRIIRGTMFETFRPLLGRPYPAEWWRDMFWRIAANEELLASGVPLRPWSAPGITEWVPLQVMRVDTAPHSRNKRNRYMLHFRVLAGFACPLIFTRALTGDWLAQFSRYAGFTKARGTRPFLSPYQFTGLRWFALLEPQYSRDGQPGFFEVRCSGTWLEHNTDLLNKRYRNKQDFTCPQNYTHECHLCPVGYMSCPAATHKLDFKWQHCLNCNQQAWFDPEISAQVCVSCWRKQVAKS